MAKIWSQDYDAYVSHSFYPLDTKKTLKLNLTDCVIKITQFGFYYLLLDDHVIKKITFDEYLRYKKHVKSIINEGYYES
jgi:hypothetical protein